MLIYFAYIDMIDSWKLSTIFVDRSIGSIRSLLARRILSKEAQLI